MTPDEAQKKYENGIPLLENQYFKDITDWILAIKPGAKTFEFDGNQEGDDEGGSYWYFSSLYIDEQDLEELLESAPNEKLNELFGTPVEDLEECEDYEEKWEILRDNMDFPEFVYSHGKIKIPKKK